MLFNPKISFTYSNDFPKRHLTFHRYVFSVKKFWHWLRVQRLTTKFLGYQYRVATEAIEIDLTYLCNLRCNNCNRSCAQAPDTTHIKLESIKQFVDDSLQTRRYWRRIRILGGEPTLHPEFNAILHELGRYKTAYPDCSIQLVTNGYGAKVNRILQSLPKSIYVENSFKSSNVQPEFGAFNLAPQDSIKYLFADYKNGCSIASTCGLGLTPQGYYPCAIAGGIDRVLGLHTGRNRLPQPTDEMRDLMDAACRLCGRFRDGHYIPPKLRPSVLKQETSPTWRKIYQDWRNRVETATHSQEAE